MYKTLLLSLSLFACSEDGFKKTNHEVALDFADHACAYFERCDSLAGSTFEECIYLVVEGTCPEGGCSTADEWDGHEDQLTACLADLDAADCANVNNDPPSSCAGIL